VHATEKKALSKHGPFESPRHNPHTPEHKAEMEAMADKVRIVFGFLKGKNFLIEYRAPGIRKYVFKLEKASNHTEI